MRLAILLGTYNGGRFLREQLDSLFAQTMKDFQLYIRDDGSTDDTMLIVKEYQQLHPNIVKVEDEGKNLGAKGNFERLLALTDADYYMFCDQDDVWLPDKIEVSFAKMKQMEQRYGDIPLLVHTDLEVVDEDLNVINASFWKYSRVLPQVVDENIHYLGIANSVTGCTIIMNKMAKQVAIPFPEQIYMHDAWIALCVMKYGKMGYINMPTIKYRQHSSNVLGAIEYRFSIKEKLKNIKTIYRNYLLVYRNGHPLVFKNIIHFLYYKFKYSVFIFHRKQNAADAISS